MKQLKVVPLVSILLYWPTNRFIGQARHWRVNRNRAGVCGCFGNRTWLLTKRFVPRVPSKHNHISTSHAPSKAYNFSILSNTNNSRHHTYSNRKRTKNHPHFDSICLLPSSPIGTSTPSVWVRRELRWRQRQMLRAWSIIVKYCNRNLMRESVFSFSITREPLCFEAITNCCCETGASKHTFLHPTPLCRRALPN
jgi:hypothetical protein